MPPPKVRVETEDLALKLAIEPRHHRDDQNKNGDPQGDAEDRDHGDDRNRGALRLEVTKREEETKRRFHEP